MKISKRLERFYRAEQARYAFENSVRVSDKAAWRITERLIGDEFHVIIFRLRARSYSYASENQRGSYRIELASDASILALLHELAHCCDLWENGYTGHHKRFSAILARLALRFRNTMLDDPAVWVE
jgi:hypothetical protein